MVEDSMAPVWNLKGSNEKSEIKKKTHHASFPDNLDQPLQWVQVEKLTKYKKKILDGNKRQWKLPS